LGVIAAAVSLRLYLIFLRVLGLVVRLGRTASSTDTELLDWATERSSSP
jgi:hypothetical protein